MPRKRTAQRVYIWRKLKRLQALLIDGAMWVLPATPRTREEFQWLAAEIIELGGQATLWEAHALQVGRDQSLQDAFLDQANARYRKLLDELALQRHFVKDHRGAPSCPCDEIGKRHSSVAG